MHCHIFILSGCLAVGCLTGCGGGDVPELATVEGIVKVAGKPLPNAIVDFTPTQKGRPSTGVTDENGRYSLVYLADTSGALIGTHKVTIERVSTDAEDVMTEEELAGLALPAGASNGTVIKEVKVGDNVIDIDIPNE